MHIPGLIGTKAVFLLGISERCGTTYLQDLLRLHPDCDVDGLELEEDHFVSQVDLLVKFVSLATAEWKAWWGPEQLEKERELLCQCLGEGLISYLKFQVRDRRALAGKAPADKPLPVLVTKTPDVRNVDLFFNFFPDADLIILVRDGRAVVESAVRTFYRNFADEARHWARNGAAIRRFAQSDSSRDRRYLIVRYEDLCTNVESELRRIILFLHLDPAPYNFAAANHLPVRGSSTLRRDDSRYEASSAAPGVHWNPVPKSADFRPLERWSNWNRTKHERFNWIGGKHLRYFGYEMKSDGGYRWLWSTWNVVLDVLPIEKAMYFWKRAVRRTKFAFSTSETALGAFRKIWSAANPLNRGPERARAMHDLP